MYYKMNRDFVLNTTKGICIRFKKDRPMKIAPMIEEIVIGAGGIPCPEWTDEDTKVREEDRKKQDAAKQLALIKIAEDKLAKEKAEVEALAEQLKDTGTAPTPKIEVGDTVETKVTRKKGKVNDPATADNGV